MSFRSCADPENFIRCVCVGGGGGGECPASDQGGSKFYHLKTHILENRGGGGVRTLSHPSQQIWVSILQTHDRFLYNIR